jgi:hypothetical protein
VARLNTGGEKHMTNYRVATTARYPREDANKAIFDRSVEVAPKTRLCSALAEKFIANSGQKEHFNTLVQKFFGAFPDASVIAKMEFSDDSKVTVELRFKEFTDDKFDLVADFLESDKSLKAKYYRLIVT